jgi:hypothetical protein
LTILEWGLATWEVSIDSGRSFKKQADQHRARARYMHAMPSGMCSPMYDSEKEQRSREGSTMGRGAGPKKAGPENFERGGGAILAGALHAFSLK